MDALILTCGTGGGHNAAAKAIEEELSSRGHRAVVLNPYTLCGTHSAGIIDRAYIHLVQYFPEGFGLLYQLGELYRLLPFRSPVYFLNKKAAAHMEDYLKGRKFDIIITTHLFSGEIMTRLKSNGADVPPVIYVATDYTCIPFTEDTDCDAYVIPAKELVAEFTAHGIPQDRIYPLGIPVCAAFRKSMTRAEAKTAVGLDGATDYFLLSGGSMGAGKLSPIVKKLHAQCGGDGKIQMIVICGSNEKLRKKLSRKYSDTIILLQSTDKMTEYICASKLYFTKPGGLSSTEAAVMGVPLVHLPPIPGCETKNARFFVEHGMSIKQKNTNKGICQTISFSHDAARQRDMVHQQQKMIRADAAQRICDLAKRMSDVFNHECGSPIKPDV